MSETTALHAYYGEADPQRTEELQKTIEAKGYFAFYKFIEEVKDALKKYEDSEIDQIGKLLSRLQNDFPSPERLSPSWSGLWEELRSIYDAKNEVLKEVTHDQRDGEWQVLIDNPYTTDQIVCYPGLSFTEAAYLYAYFKHGLKPNEYLRLQKVYPIKIVTPGR